MPKFFASDAGLVANCLDWNEDETFVNSDLSGKLVESWVYHELSAIAECSEGRYAISHYRDKSVAESSSRTNLLMSDAWLWNTRDMM